MGNGVVVFLFVVRDGAENALDFRGFADGLLVAFSFVERFQLLEVRAGVIE